MASENSGSPAAPPAGNEYSWEVAMKKIAYGLAKGLTGVLMFHKAQIIETKMGITIDPVTFKTGAAVVILGILAAAHDWAKVKWPNVKWLGAALLALALTSAPQRAMADTPTNAPTTVTAFGDQLLLSLIGHVTAVSEATTKGQIKVQFLDGLVNFGHYQGDYIVSLDAGFSDSLSPDAEGHLAATYGAHLHVISGVNKLLNVSPTLGATLDMLELTPRISYDEDVHKWVKGICFGAQIRFQ
jgi:hypothetical protein